MLLSRKSMEGLSTMARRLLSSILRTLTNSDGEMLVLTILLSALVPTWRRKLVMLISELVRRRSWCLHLLRMMHPSLFWESTTTITNQIWILSQTLHAQLTAWLQSPRSSMTTGVLLKALWQPSMLWLLTNNQLTDLQREVRTGELVEPVVTTSFLQLLELLKLSVK